MIGAEMVRSGKLVVVTGWMRRTYDDRRYVDGARHAIVDEDPSWVLTACGRRLVRVTSSRVANRLVPAPAELIRSDHRTCAGCLAATSG